jgi:hypothetical protein
MAMSHTTPARRTASALAASALIALLAAAPAAARQDPGTGGRDFGPGDRVSSPTPAGTLVVDDDAVEYLQVGAGLLAGIALAGAGAALVSRRNHREPSPA